MQTGPNEWAVWHGSASCEYCAPEANALRVHTEKEAFAFASDMADKIEDDGYLEYGIQTITPEEQRQGLLYTLRDTVERLERLLTTGKQFKVWDSDEC